MKDGIWKRLFDQLGRKNQQYAWYMANYRAQHPEEDRWGAGICGEGQLDYPLYCRQCGYHGTASSSQPFFSRKDVFGNPGRMCPNCGSQIQTEYLKYGGHTGDPCFEEDEEYE